MDGRPVQLEQLDLNRLHTFFAVAETGGVTAAARRLAVTPSAVSQSLAKLEAQLSVQLFDRVGRRLVPTEEGRLLRRRFREHQERLRETLEEITRADRDPRGTVRVGLFLGFPHAPLAHFLAGFSADHPAVTLRVIYGSQGELDDGLESGRVDCAFALGGPARDGRRRTLSAVRLFEQELVLVGRRRWFRSPFDFDALTDLPIVDYYQGDPLIHRWIAHHFRRKAPPLDVRAWAATTNLALDLILEGAGAGVLPRHVALPHVRRRRLFVLETGRRELSDSIWLRERAGGYRGRALEAFRAAALSAFSSLADHSPSAARTAARSSPKR